MSVITLLKMRHLKSNIRQCSMQNSLTIFMVQNLIQNLPLLVIRKLIYDLFYSILLYGIVESNAQYMRGLLGSQVCWLKADTRLSKNPTKILFLSQMIPYYVNPGSLSWLCTSNRYWKLTVIYAAALFSFSCVRNAGGSVECKVPHANYIIFQFIRDTLPSCILELTNAYSSLLQIVNNVRLGRFWNPQLLYLQKTIKY